MNNLEAQLWKIAEDLRGSMDGSEFKNYMLGFIFLKYLGEKVEQEIKYHIGDIELSEIQSNEEHMNKLRNLVIDDLGYMIEPEDLFSELIKKINVGQPIIEDLDRILKSIENSAASVDSHDDFIGLFDDIDLSNNKLGTNGDEKNKTISRILLSIDDIEGLTSDVDVLGKAYEYLLKQFASSAGKKGGEFYTPEEVSELVARLATSGKERVKSLYDPTCGSGSLLIKASKKVKYNTVCGQELNTTTYNLARMNMFLHGVNYRKFNIKQGNTLTNDKFGDEQFDVIVANPPFGVKWEADAIDLNADERFSRYGKLAPKSKGEYAFIQTMVHHLAENGTLATVVPHGVLFRGAAEKTIRQYMIEKENILDAVIGLPSNLFYGTGIPAAILVFKKNRTTDDIIFIDASNEFEKVKTQNILTEENLQKIVKTYEERATIEKYSQKVELSEIIENDYNLNIPRYVDTFEEEEPIDIIEVSKEYSELVAQEKQIREDLLNQLEDLNGEPEILAAIKSMLEVR